MGTTANEKKPKSLSPCFNLVHINCGCLTCFLFPVTPFPVKLGCCGVNKYTDWNGTAYFNENGIPTSCCKVKHCSPESLKDLKKAATEVYEQVRFECGCHSSESLVLSWWTKSWIDKEIGFAWWKVSFCWDRGCWCAWVLAVWSWIHVLHCLDLFRAVSLWCPLKWKLIWESSPASPLESHSSRYKSWLERWPIAAFVGSIL